MEPIKTYFTRSKAEVDAAKLMANNIPSTIVGNDRSPCILSQFPQDPIELLVPRNHVIRANMILKNKDNALIKIFKILTYKSYMQKQLKEEKRQARIEKHIQQ